jgi:GntR family transcriptional regulator / MocR family aminotransferase
MGVRWYGRQGQFVRVRPDQSAIVDLLLDVDRRARRPLHEQIFDRVRARILAGELAPGARLPSSRRIAADLGVARTTVLQAFDALAAEGFVVARAASATRVAPELPVALEPAPPRPQPRSPLRPSHVARAFAAVPAGTPRLGRPPRAFRPGCPALDRFPVALWTRIAARCHARASTALLDGGDPLGDPQLRAAIAAHVTTARGVRCTADQVFVTAGTQLAFDEILRLLVDPGDAVWIEDPGYLGARLAVLGARARPVAVPVDELGLDVAAGIARAPRARAVVLAPSHQYPLGATLPLARRLALLRWAAAARALVIEDDYDSEFRHRGRPLTALYGLDEADRVVYVGTFSKSLFPGLRIGFFVAPPSLVDAFAGARASLPAPASTLDQAALARFIADGHFATHLRRMRATYRERGEALRDALAADCTGALAPLPLDTGMQLVARLTVPVADTTVAAHAALLGVEVGALSSYALRARPRGLVFGFGGVRPAQIRAGTRLLAQALTRATSDASPDPDRRRRATRDR